MRDVHEGRSSNARGGFTLLIVVVAILLATAALLHVQDGSEDVLQEQRAVAVLLHEAGGLRCHGVVVSHEGLVLTAGHCEPQSQMSVLVDGHEYDFRVVYAPMPISKRFEGVTVLRLSGGEWPRDLPALERRRTLPNRGERCYIPPLPGESAVRRWSTIRSTTVMGNEGLRMLQTDHVIVPGDSGRPLLDADGRVIGLLSGSRPAHDEAIWIPAADESETSWSGVPPEMVIIFEKPIESPEDDANDRPTDDRP